MNKIKIGQFIAKCRKEQSLTQEQLAAMLDVSSKSVSKWENGYCLPDSSLYNPLCHIFNINLNELFIGKKTQEDYLMRMLKYKLYNMSDKNISFLEFSHALNDISYITSMLESFINKEEAIEYFMKESLGTYDECSKAYDFYIHLFEVSL